MYTSNIHGRKGGSAKASTPDIAPDDLRSIAKAKILIALGEGEFYGQLTGKDIFLDGTPLLDDQGNENFPGVAWEFRSGSQDQSYIQGIPSTESETAVGVELTSKTPWVRTLTGRYLSAIRLRFRWPALFEQKNNGDQIGYRIEYAIDVATDGGSYETLLTTAVDGASYDEYEHSHRVNLPPGDSWQIRVRRITANKNSTYFADAMYISAITEVVDRKFRHPNTALLYVEFDASQFQNIPAISCAPYGRLVRVPANYDPFSRHYSGVWDGSFVWAWSDNPAWVSYDVILSDRFGTGDRITQNQVDKWELYNIAQYCDQLVSDGKGGMEPRYTCNICISEASEAWQVLRDLAAIYRGMTYWAAGQMYTFADMPRDTDYVFSNADVIDGSFTYSGTDERDIYTRALISWDNPDNGYESDVTSISDTELQRRYGDKVIEMSAIGCTRESEAQRRGKWALYTNSNGRIVTFRTALEGLQIMPGYIIGVADRLIAGAHIGGRIAVVADTTITLDRAPRAKAGDRLIINLPSGQSEARTIERIDDTAITVTTAYSETPAVQHVWSIDADDLALQLYRVTSVSRPENNQVEITGVYLNPEKWDAVDSGARLQQRPISVIPTGVMPAPTSVAIEQMVYTEQTMAVTTMVIHWPKVQGAVAFDVQWRKDSGQWISIPRTGALSAEVKGVYTGQYLARVRAVNAVGAASLWQNSMLTDVSGKVGTPPSVIGLAAESLVFGIALSWDFPNGAEDSLVTEFEYNTSADDEGVMTLGSFAYPQRTHTLTGLASGTQFYFRARLHDRSGNIGPWCDWCAGQASADASLILDYLSAQISETQLAQSLLEPIQKIADIDTVRASLVDVRNSLDDAQQQLIVSRAELAGQQQALSENISKTQTIDAARALIDERLGLLDEQIGTIGTKVTDVTTQAENNAERLTAVAASGAESASRVATLEQASSEQAQSIHDLQTSTEGQGSRLTSVEQTTGEQAQALQQLQTGLDEQGSSLSQLQQTSVSQAQSLQELETVTEGQGSRLTSVEQTTSGQAQAITQLQSEQNGLSSSVTELRRADAGSAERDAWLQVQRDNAAAEALVQEAVTAQQAQRQVVLHARQDDAESSLTELQSVTDEQSLQQRELSTALGEQNSRLTSVEQTTGEQAQAINQLQSEQNGQAAQIEQTAQTVATLDGDLSAMWKVSLGVTQDGKYYAAGFGTSIENSDQGLQSNFYVLADRFAVLNQANGASTLTTPFVIQNGSVVMNDAFIGTLNNKTLIQRVGGMMQVFGVGFGVNNEFMEWYGPDVGDIANCSRAQAHSYKTINGDAYFGGTLNAGTLKNGADTTIKTLYLNDQVLVEVGPFATNGNVKNISISYSLLATSPSTTEPNDMPNPYVSWQLQKWNGTTWTVLTSGTFTGTAFIDHAGPSEFYASEINSGSVTYADPATSTDDVRYRIVCTGYQRTLTPSQVNHQTFTLLSIEQ